MNNIYIVALGDLNPKVTKVENKHRKSNKLPKKKDKFDFVCSETVTRKTDVYYNSYREEFMVDIEDEYKLEY